MKVRQLVILLLSLMVIQCSEPEVTSRNYPRVSTLDVTNVSSVGARFNAEVIYLGDFEILSYGFVWSESDGPELGISEKKIFDGSNFTVNFSADIKTTLSNGIRYYVRPFVMTNKYTVYGKTVSFYSKGSGFPTISSFTPTTGKVGDTIEISGTDFSYRKGSMVVKFDSHVADIVSTSDTLIHVVVPPTLSSAQSAVRVSVVGAETIAPVKFTLN